MKPEGNFSLLIGVKPTVAIQLSEEKGKKNKAFCLVLMLLIDHCSKQHTLKVRGEFCVEDL